MADSGCVDLIICNQTDCSYYSKHNFSLEWGNYIKVTQILHQSTIRLMLERDDLKVQAFV